MKNRYTHTIILVLIIILVSCNVENENPEEEMLSIYPNVVISSDDLDSLFLFGAISDVDHLSNGNIAILDRLSASAFIFSPDGEFQYSIGGKGNGPGEFNSPDCLVPVSHDSLWIFDKSIRKITLFDEEGNHIADISDIEDVPFPYWCSYIGSGRFLGGMMYMDANDAGYNTNYSICTMTEQLIAIDTLYTNVAPYVENDMTSLLDNTIFSCAFTGDVNGNIFITSTSDQYYNLVGYNSAGEVTLNINKSTPRVQKSDASLVLESERFNSMLRARNSGTTDFYSPPQYMYSIPPQGLHTDNCDRIWILNGAYRHPVFDVYDYRGVHITSIELLGMDEEDTIDVLWWSISEYGILAFSIDPYEFPKVYVYKLPDSLRRGQ